MERRKFEESFQDAFKDAEVNPSENVWTNIELDLEKAQGDKMKRRLLFFQSLAAASIAFAMCVAGIGYYVMNQNTNANLAHQSSPANSPDESHEPGGNDSNASLDTNANKESTAGDENAAAPFAQNNTESLSSEAADDLQRASDNVEDQSTALSKSSIANSNAKEKESFGNENSKAQHSTTPSQQNSNVAKNGAPLISAGKHQRAAQSESLTTAKTTPTVTSSTLGGNDASTTSYNNMALAQGSNESIANPDQRTVVARRLPQLYQSKAPELKLSDPNVSSAIDPGKLYLLKLEEEQKKWAAEDKKQAKNKSEKLWTSLGFAAGGFSANNSSVGGTPANSMYAMNSSQTATQQTKANGVSYSVGVGFGTKLSERWVLQSGLNYLTQSSDYTANSVVVVDNNYADPKAASLNAFAPQMRDETADTKVAATFPYNVNNNVRFVSVPLQAGYLLVNKKFGLQLNAGVSTDLFLQNTITPDGAGLTKTTQGRGDESPYRSLNFSGLMGTEFSYRLGYRYRLSLNPGLRYPFSSVYKSNTGVESTPVTFDVGLRFKYIFH